MNVLVSDCKHVHLYRTEQQLFMLPAMIMNELTNFDSMIMVWMIEGISSMCGVVYLINCLVHS